MIFKDKLCQKVLDGTKTQTRRLKKKGEYTPLIIGDEIVAVFDDNQRKKWQIGKTYAVQPGHGKHAIGRIGITKIRREHLQEIAYEDAIAEGIRKLYRCPQWLPGEVYKSFCELWDSIHPKGKRWKDNPEVWVLDFELVKP